MCIRAHIHYKFDIERHINTFGRYGIICERGETTSEHMRPLRRAHISFIFNTKCHPPPPPIYRFGAGVVPRIAYTNVIPPKYFSINVHTKLSTTFSIYVYTLQTDEINR